MTEELGKVAQNKIELGGVVLLALGTNIVGRKRMRSGGHLWTSTFDNPQYRARLLKLYV